MKRETSVTAHWLIAVAIGLGSVACGDDSPHLADAGPDDQTFTAFVIDLVNNHTGDEAPVSYDAFKDLADPDADMNNVSAFAVLFP